jgi:DNA-binding beta-propeller fold protein YncE
LRLKYSLNVVKYGSVFFMKKILFLPLLLLLSCENQDQNPALDLVKGDIVICNGGDNSLSVIDSKTFTEKQRFYLPSTSSSFAHHVYFSDDFSKISIAMPSYDFSQGHGSVHTAPTEGRVLVLNTLDTKTINSFKLPAANHDVLVDSPNNEIWTQLVTKSAKVLVYSFDNKILAEIPVEADPAEIIFAKNNTLAVISSEESNFLTVINKKSRKISAKIKIDLGPTGLAKGRTDTEILVSNTNKKTLNLVDINESKVIDFLDLDFEPGYASFKNEKEIWILAPKLNKIKIFEKSNSTWKIKSEIPTEKDPHHILFFENKSKAIVVNQQNNSADVITTSDYKMVKRIKIGSKPNGSTTWE